MGSQPFLGVINPKQLGPIPKRTGPIFRCMGVPKTSLRQNRKPLLFWSTSPRLPTSAATSALRRAACPSGHGSRSSGWTHRRSQIARRGFERTRARSPRRSRSWTILLRGSSTPRVSPERLSIMIFATPRRGRCRDSLLCRSLCRCSTLRARVCHTMPRRATSSIRAGRRMAHMRQHRSEHLRRARSAAQPPCRLKGCITLQAARRARPLTMGPQKMRPLMQPPHARR